MYCNTLQTPLLLLSSTLFNVVGHVISSSPVAFQRLVVVLAAGQLPASVCLQHHAWRTAPSLMESCQLWDTRTVSRVLSHVYCLTSVSRLSLLVFTLKNLFGYSDWNEGGLTLFFFNQVVSVSQRDQICQPQPDWFTPSIFPSLLPPLIFHSFPNSPHIAPSL